MHRSTILVLIASALLFACGSPPPTSTGAGGSTSSATAGIGGGTASATGTGGSAPVPQPFTSGDPTCSGVWHDTARSKGVYGGKDIDETGAVSAYMATPPAYPATFATATFPAVKGVPFHSCLATGPVAWVYWITTAGAPDAHPDPAKIRTGTADLGAQSWSMTPAGSSVADVAVTLDPPLVADVGEALYGGPIMAANADGTVCTRLCEDSDHDPDSWWSALNFAYTVDPCPNTSCALAHLYDTPTPSLAAQYGVDKMRNVGTASGTTEGK